ncbi:MAG: DMT family transporter [Firmicutes bacterium]|nr:DMT family transporter [Bacillota bacterium]
MTQRNSYGGSRGEAAGPSQRGTKALSPLQADMILLLVTVIWGGTFPVLKLLVVALSPLYLVGIRFLLAFAVLTPFAWLRLRQLDKRTLKIGIFLGLLLWGGFLSQTAGIQYTTASKAAFITALSVVITPVLSTLFLRKRPESAAIAGAALATVGLGLLTLDFSQGLVLAKGDLWVLLSAFLYAFQIITVDRYGAATDSLLLTWVEVGTVATIGLVAAVLSEPWPSLGGGTLWGGLLYLALFATAAAQYLQIWAQPYTTPTQVSLLFSLEPVFAAGLAYLILGERLPPVGQVGAGLMLIGAIVSELWGLRERELAKEVAMD